MLFSIYFANLLFDTKKLVWTAKVDGYRFEKFVRPDNEDPNYEDHIETLVVKDSRNRIVTRMECARVTPLFDTHLIRATISKNFVAAEDGDGKFIEYPHAGLGKAPIFVFNEWSGGAHGSNTYFIWSLGKHPRCLLAYDKNNVSDGHDFDIGMSNGHLEIHSWFDGFAYTIGSSEWHNLPVVLDLIGNKFVDTTKQHPAILRAAMHRAWVELLETDQKQSPQSWSRPTSTCYNLIALGDLLGTSDHVWHRLQKTVSRSEIRWLRKRIPSILRVIHGRKLRYKYPVAYDRQLLKFDYGSLHRAEAALSSS